MRNIGGILEMALWLFALVLIVRLVAEWVQLFARSCQPRWPVLVVLVSVYTVNDPPLLALRRVVPPLRLGGISIALSLMLLLVICWVLRRLNQWLLLS